jgi:hypothetical protein
MSIALELYEVLEEEHVSTGGELAPLPDAKFTDADVLNRAAVATALGVGEAAIVTRLEQLRKSEVANDVEGPTSLGNASSRLSLGIRRLLQGYGAADEQARRRINRRVLEDVLGNTLRAARPLPIIEADQIVNEDSCRVTLQQCLRGDYETATAIAAKIESLRLIVDGNNPLCPAVLFATSPHVSRNTTLLLADYADTDTKDEQRLAINRRILDEVFDGGIARYCDVRLAHLYGELHKQPDERSRTALCISGGGIRSATFALGVMQGLASHGLLKGFDYLSTVSGGGYIGSWLSSWARRHPDGIEGVERDLAAIDSGGAARAQQLAANIVPVDDRRDTSRTPKLEPEAKPLRHLREYSNYLTPRVGIFSGDTWAFVALYLRNLTINLLVLVPLLAAILAGPRACAWLLRNIADVPFWLLMAVVDVSLLALFWYIGASRPVRHGSQADLPWPISKLSLRARHLIFNFAAGTGAAFGITFAWAKWVSLHGPENHTTQLDDFAMIIGVVFAGAAMLIFPCLTYFRRYLKVSYAGRRESIAAGKGEGNRRIRNNRIIAESVAAILAGVGAIALFWFFAVKVFEDPLGQLYGLTEVSRFLLAGQPLVSHGLLFICFAPPAVMFVLFLQATVFVAGSGKWNEDYDREWWGRTSGWVLVGSIAWIVLAGVSIFGPLAIHRFPTIISALGGISGLVAIGLGRSPKSAAARKSDTAATTSDKALSIATPLFCLFLLAGISWLTTLIIEKVRHTEATDQAVSAQLQSVVTAPPQAIRVGGTDYIETLRTKPIASVSKELLTSHAHLKTVQDTTGEELAIILLVAAAALGASFAVGANRFSMHALYRNRLIRAYLGASRYDRDPDAVTGFDPYDNLQMYKLRPELLWATSFRKLDAFIAELREPTKELSKKITNELLQQGTENLLTNTGIAESLDAVVALFDGKTPPDRIRAAIEHNASYLPRAARRIARIQSVSAADLERIAVDVRRDAGKEKARLLSEGERSDLVDALFQDLNRILIEEDLRDEKERTLTLTRVERAINNRRIFDDTYEDFVVRMPPLDRTQRAEGHRLKARAPLHIVNTALNLASGENLAWQQRQAESFTISPLHSGSAFVGYRDSREYGDGLRGISLGTAVTISGAAASPNQGYHSSPALAFLLTMFNVRLGWWLGNPGAAGKSSYTMENPKSGVTLLAREMLGDTNDTYDWVYLSDGGHFENLGLYEMILRRCRYIIVSDGGCDPKFNFEDLGNAIRKIRIDLGIPIEFNEMPMRTRDEDEPWNYVATGDINYKAVDGPHAKVGKLIYLKPGYYRDEGLPKDIVNYAKECSDFPHETTADQWFSESQFESYRMLGRHVIEHVAPKPPEPSAPDTWPAVPTVPAFATYVARPKTDAAEVYVPVVAQHIKIPGRKGGATAVILPPR